MKSAKFDWSLALLVISLSVIGIVNIYSASHANISVTSMPLYQKQIIWVVLGLMLMFIVSFINYQLIGYYSLYIYIFGLFLLVLTLLIADPINNAKRWLNLGLFSLQTSEFIKIAFIILLGKYIELRGTEIKKFRELIITAFFLSVPLFLILLQPDLGTGLSLIPIFLIMLFVGGADNTHLISIVAIGFITLLIPLVSTYRDLMGLTKQAANPVLNFFTNPDYLFWIGFVLAFLALILFLIRFFMNIKIMRRIYIPTTILSVGFILSVLVANYFKPYQKKRILTFLNPELDPLGAGYNVIQSKIAVGSGEFFGKGFLKGTQNQLGFLPEKSTDFIFPVLAEEWGFLGAMLVIFLFLLLIVRGIQIAYESKDMFGSVLAAGITSLLFYHVTVNIGMAVGIMPVTGLLLPFISYGGSNLFISMMAIGILLNIRMRKFAN